MARLSVRYLRNRFARVADVCGWDHTGERWTRREDGKIVTRVRANTAAELDAWFEGVLYAKERLRN